MSQKPSQPSSGAAAPATFADTLDRLEERRRADEADLIERLERLDDGVRRLVETLARAAALAGPGRLSASGAAADQLAEAGRLLSEGRPGVAWPAGQGGLRGLINRVARWLLRDYLEALDRRAEAVAATTDDLRAAAQALVEALVIHERALRAAQEIDAGVVEVVHEAVDAASQAVSGVADVLEALRRVIDAKDAETLQRAAAGPLRKMELTFDELGRQQEALLAELVGRRHQLDALIERLQASGRRDASAG